MSREIKSYIESRSRYGSKRSYALMYADEKCSIWRMTCSDVFFFNGSYSSKNKILLESVDFDGGPYLFVGDDFLSHGRISQFLTINTESRIDVLIICAID